jgi:hypothetical protein
MGPRVSFHQLQEEQAAQSIATANTEIALREDGFQSSLARRKDPIKM